MELCVDLYGNCKCATLPRFAVAVNNSLMQIKSQLGEIEFPFLILHGDKDKLCDINGSKMMHKEAKSVDKELQVNCHLCLLK